MQQTHALQLNHLLGRLAALRRAAAPRSVHEPQHARALLAPFSSSPSASSSALPSSPPPPPHRATPFAAVFDESGEPDAVLRVRELPLRPVRGAGEGGLREGEVLLELEAAPINPSDVNTIQGRYPLRPTTPGAVPGHEGVFRVVEAAGAPASAAAAPAPPPPLRPGDRVVPLRPALGTWRSSGIFRAQDWHRVPPELPLAAAATLCVNPPTALGLLSDFVDVRGAAAAAAAADAKARSKAAAAVVVAQTGATSAVGQLVAQLARHWGARTVNLVREREDWDETRAWLRGMGADLVTTEARARRDVAEAGLPPALLALDCVGGSSSAAAARLLAPGGTLVSYGAMSLQPVTVPASLLIFKDVQVRGFWLSGGGRRRRRQQEERQQQQGDSNNKGDDDETKDQEDLRARRETLDRAAALFLEGVFRPPPTELVPLREALGGVARAREGKTRTKVLLVP